MPVIMSHSTARAVLDQIRSGSHSEMTLLLGEDAATPGFCADEGAVLERLQIALSGGDADVSLSVRRHLGGIVSNAVDVALLASAGLDVGVTAYQVASMGALACLAGSHEIRITAGPMPMRRLTYDMPIGIDGTWTSCDGDITVTIHRLPGTLAAALSARADGDEPLPLRTVVAHPLLDAFDLQVTHVEALDWGGARLTVSGDGPLEDRPLAELLARREDASHPCYQGG